VLTRLSSLSEAISPIIAALLTGCRVRQLAQGVGSSTLKSRSTEPNQLAPSSDGKPSSFHQLKCLIIIKDDFCCVFLDHNNRPTEKRFFKTSLRCMTKRLPKRNDPPCALPQAPIPPGVNNVTTTQACPINLELLLPVKRRPTKSCRCSENQGCHQPFIEGAHFRTLSCCAHI
jgi:hypothetical protein